MVSVFLKLKNRKAMAAAGLAHVCARTNFTLTIINRKRSLKHVANRALPATPPWVYQHLLIGHGCMEFESDRRLPAH